MFTLGFSRVDDELQWCRGISGIHLTIESNSTPLTFKSQTDEKKAKALSPRNTLDVVCYVMGRKIFGLKAPLRERIFSH
jgi:hypothetical protein